MIVAGLVVLEPRGGLEGPGDDLTDEPAGVEHLLRGDLEREVLAGLDEDVRLIWLDAPPLDEP
ncbi:hypothetical protein NE236_36245 [Actinoallomurus purpureus]|uniref:hypothetical protein n=1 Tax=Actinoallomurus purpureus TaxID=478114 RepID=UPI0020934D99|nr:hypothetical protein [Actinoallomurus purpureus]MCO6010425.1 hypothetical protein [Actinoallomurus purpureus]